MLFFWVHLQFRWRRRFENSGLNPFKIINSFGDDLFLYILWNPLEQVKLYHRLPKLDRTRSLYLTDAKTAIYQIKYWTILVIGICHFDIVCNLSIVIWDFYAVSGKINRFYLDQLELTLTFPYRTGVFLT